ncbi:MAG: Gfo/Idh/MocA family protein [Terriglobales bacterium]
MRVGILGTGAIAQKHALAYRNIGYGVVACSNRDVAKGQRFAQEHKAEFVPTVEALCKHPDLDYIDVCALPEYRLPVVELCAASGKHVLVEKPMATRAEIACEMIRIAHEARIQLGVVSQHRFDDSTLFLRKALAEGRLGKLLQADAYVKWYRSPEYYSRPVKGSWAGEGGGALINQAIHQVDLLLHLAGPVVEVCGYRQLGALHRIESEDIISAVLRYSSGATGVIQASTAFWPGYPERVELHGTKGSASISGDRLSVWNVREDHGEPAPVKAEVSSGASDPMAISTLPFERQFLDFGEACRTGRRPLVSGIDGYRALQLICGIYQSCAENRSVSIPDYSLELLDRCPQLQDLSRPI